MHEYAFAIDVVPARWCLLPKLRRYERGQWQFKWLCFYMHRQSVVDEVE